MNSLTRRVAAASLALSTGLVGLAPSALANSAYSSKVYYPNGAYLWAYAYLDSQSDSGGCGNYNAWSQISKRPSWIKVVAQFSEDGFGSVSVGAVSGTISGSSPTLSWTNSNGALGAYLSGRACMSWAAWYLHLQTTGSSLQYGTVRTVQTRQL
jgi:hypothetical protein